MVGIVLASHGELAAGVRQTGSLVFGDQENVAVVSLEPSMGPDDFRANLEKAVASLEDQEQVLFLVDLWGGTPFNQTSAFAKGHDTWAIVTGLNLPMLIEAYSARFDATKTAHDIAAHLVSEGRKGVRVLPEELEPAAPATKVAAARAGAIAPGTVLGDGKIDIAAVRIDTRLLHGQVATAWTKQIAPNRIIVVSDGVAHDELRKTKAVLLFETPQDLRKCIEGGVDIKKVNIGSMAHSVGKVVVTNAIAMGEDDVKTIEKLRELGVDFEARKVPSDSSENIDDMLKKAKADLAAQANQ